MAERKRNRAAVKSLKSPQLGPFQAGRYAKAVQYFVLVMLKLYGFVAWWNFEALDDQVSTFVELAFHEGEPKWLAADVIGGVTYFLNRKRILTGSWRLYSLWDAMEEVTQTPPISLELLLAVCGNMIRMQRVDCAVAALVAFSLLLRTGEMFCMRWCDFIAGAQEWATPTSDY